MNAVSNSTLQLLIPFALRDAPSLIEVVFPAQKMSFEAQSERKAVASQTLTALGSYWKGRKPLILVRAIVLGCLLPQTSNREKDLEIYEGLLALDDEALARRAVAADAFRPQDIAKRISLQSVQRYFNVKSKDHLPITEIRFPIDCDESGISLRWSKDVGRDEKLELYREALRNIGGYEDKAGLGKRPEEVDQDWLYAPVWPVLNSHYAHLGINARSVRELVQQLGVLRFGHVPKVGDTFSGGGSIPFEAARVGCEVYASDLNPIACMLSWSALNIAGLAPEARASIDRLQQQVFEAVNKELNQMELETDQQGNRAKAFLYCLETRCPESGWSVPLSPSWVVSNARRVIAKLVPNYEDRRFDIQIVGNVSHEDLAAAARGTVRDGDMVYELDGRTYRVPIKTLRGEYRSAEGTSKNSLRQWQRSDFRPSVDDVFQERLYAIQWITRETVSRSKQDTFFATVTAADLDRERRIAELVQEELDQWQESGLVSDMAIESGKENEGPIRTNGWTYWHHMFTPRVLLYVSLLRKQLLPELHQLLPLMVSKFVDNNSKSCRWAVSQSGGDGGAKSTFDNPSLKTIFNWANRAFGATPWDLNLPRFGDLSTSATVLNQDARETQECCDLFVTDPPYADAVHYHEITEFFIAWLRKNPPSPFDQWTWDSRRALAIKGSGNDFRNGMVAAYRAMAEQMPDSGMQCVMFTHQDTAVWADMVGIFWAAGLQVVAAWYIATETTSELKKGGYVQGTVILMLKKRPPGERAGFKQRVLPSVRAEVERQIQSMMHLNSEVRSKHGEPVFNDSDLQMGGYAAALKVLTAYTHIGGEDVTTFALRPRQKGEVTVVDEIVQQAAEAANTLLVPEDLNAETWAKLNGIQRFYLRMMDMETTGASKLDNYQNFAKAFRVQDYVRVMGNMTANKARLKRVTEFVSRDLTDSTEIGGTVLGNMIIGMQQLLKDVEPQSVISQLQAETPDFIEMRPLMIDTLAFIERKSPETNVRSAAEVLGARLRNLRAIGQ